MDKHIYRDRNGNFNRKPKNKILDWRISAYSFIERNNKILMIRPVWNKDRYDLPGGQVEIDENIEEGLKREALEETGYKIKIESKKPIYLNEDDFYAMGLDKFYHSIVMIFSCTLLDKKQYKSFIQKGDKKEPESIEWVSLSDIDSKDCNRIFKEFIKEIKSR